MAVEYGEIDATYKNATSLQWDAYRKSLVGSSACWSGKVVDVNSQWLGGYKILVDMDNTGVQDVNLEDLGSEASSYGKDQRVSWCGTIKSVVSVFGPIVTFSKPSLR